MKTRKFTLVEVLAVMTIIAILTGMVVAGAAAVRSKNSSSKTIALMKQMEVALEMYRADWGYYPQRAAGVLDWDKEAFKNMQGRYYLDDYEAGEWLDGYGELFRYEAPGTRIPEKYDLWSFGQDKTNNTDDDIANWKRN